MASNPGRPLSKEELLKAVWPDTFVEESSLSQNVFVVRKALGIRGEGTIQTLSGRGYLFAVPVAEIAPPNAVTTLPPGMTFEATETRVVFQEDSEEHVPFWKSPVTLTFASTALVLLGVSGWLGWQRWEDRVGGSPVQVVVADLDGSSGDPVLDRTLGTVLKIEMAQSPFVTVVSQATVRSTLAFMLHKPDDPVIGQVASDLCQRTNSQAVIHIAVARAGSRYLLTEDATDCADGSSLATAKQEVAKVDDLPRAITKNGASIRHSLGESRRMIARFNQPLLPVGTGSIEALKDYSQAYYLGQHGRFPESLELLKHAVAIDPKFGAAYLNLGVFSSNMGDFSGAKVYIERAYELRDDTTEPTRLFITAYYHQEITEDLYEAIRNYKAWIELYPKQAQPWAGMSEAYRQMGDQSEAVTAAQHTLQLSPNQAIIYYSLANAQMRTGDYAGATATCRLAISRNLDGESVRLTLLRLGHLRNDAGLMDEQESWLKAHPDSPLFLLNLANFAQAEGRMKDAQHIFDEAAELYKRQGAPGAAAHFITAMSASWWDLGEPDLARKYLYAAPMETEFNTLLALAELGGSDKAEALLRKELEAHPQSTLWVQRYSPLLRGEFALLAHKPEEAIALMAPSRQLDGMSLDGYYLRGKAYMEANQLELAESEFRNLLSHPYLEPTSAGLPLAHLQLARILARRGDRYGAIAGYNDFLRAWKNADKEARLLKQAQTELRELQK
jgi:tetratricopeptide (TPR) repeat protein